MYSLAPLLIHHESVPAAAREALRAASTAPPELRNTELKRAAYVLHHDAGLECSDARELVGLEGSCDSAC
jgi:hypothetical protein